MWVSGKSKRLLSLPVVLGALGCVGLCSVPLLGVLGGSAMTAVVCSYVDPLAKVIMGVAVAVGGGFFLRQRLRRRQAAASACAADASCGCDSGETLVSIRSGIDDDCSLPTGEMSGRLDDFRRFFQGSLVGRKLIDNGLEWTFADVPGVEQVVRDMARREQACCPVFGVDIQRRGDGVHWRLTWPPHARALGMMLYVASDHLRQEANPTHTASLAGITGVVANVGKS